MSSMMPLLGIINLDVFSSCAGHKTHGATLRDELSSLRSSQYRIRRLRAFAMLAVVQTRD